MRHPIIVFSSIFAAALPGVALAEEAAPSWSIGAGLGLPTLTSTNLYGGTLGVGQIVGAQVTFERALSPSWWLLLQANGGIDLSRSDAPPSGTAGVPIRTNAYSAGVAAGLRYAFNPDGPLVASAFASVGASFFHSDGEYSGTPTVPASLLARTVSGRAGFVLDRELIESLALRLSVGVVSAAWTEVHVSETRSDSYGVFLTLTPAVELRYVF